MFGSNPKLNVVSLLEKVDNPELDTSKYLDQDVIQNHQSLIGAIQLAIPLSKLDVNATIVTLASFRTEPREGHLDRARRVVSYLVQFKHDRRT